MIGSGIGYPIGLDSLLESGGASSQALQLNGYVKIPNTLTKIDLEYNLNAKLVQGNDITLKLKVYDLSGREIDLAQIENVIYAISDASGAQIVTKNLGYQLNIYDGFINADVKEEDSNPLIGTYFHEFVVLLKDGSTCTVIMDCELTPAEFEFRRRYASAQN